MMAELVKKYKGTFTKEEIEDHWTTWVLQGNSWKNMEGPVCTLATSHRSGSGQAVDGEQAAVLEGRLQ